MAVHQVTDTEFAAQLQQNEKVVVKYYTDWCGSCKLFAPTFKRLSEDAHFSEIHFIEVNSEKNPLATAAIYNDFKDHEENKEQQQQQQFNREKEDAKAKYILELEDRKDFSDDKKY